MSTLQQFPTRLVLLISGDKFQLPPLTTDNYRTTNGINIYQLEELTRIPRNLNLTSQHGCIDDKYLEILNHLHYWKPTPQILHKLQQERLMHTTQSINKTELSQIILNSVSQCSFTNYQCLILQNFFPRKLMHWKCPNGQ